MRLLSLTFASIAYKKWRAFNSLKQMVYVGGIIKVADNMH